MFGEAAGALRRLTSSSFDLLPRLQSMVLELQATTKVSRKISIVRQHTELHDFLRYFVECDALYVTSKGISKQVKEDAGEGVKYHDCIFALLDDLRSRAISGHRAILAVQAFLAKHDTSLHSLILCIIDRDLKIGMGLRSLCRALSDPEQRPAPEPTGQSAALPPHNERRISLSPKGPPPKMFPRTSKELPVALGYPLQRSGGVLDKHPLDFWLISRKFDGIRCLAHYDGHALRMLTRAGNELRHLAGVASELRALAQQLCAQYPDLRSFYIDGELCVVKEEGREGMHSHSTSRGLNEDFCATLSLVLARPADPARLDQRRLCFFAFDLIDPAALKDVILSERLARLRTTTAQGRFERVRVVEQYRTRNPHDFQMFLEDRQREQWEGLIVRRDCGFVGKRTRDIVKIKDFYEAEFTVEDYRTQTMQVTVDGRHAQEVLLSSVKIRLGGGEVWVGSGFSLEERRRFAADPETLRGCQITVRYFEESVNRRDGQRSLRFPTIKAVHHGGRST